MNHVKLTKIQDIVPYILEHAKTLPIAFEKAYEHLDGYETWFPIETETFVDFVAADEAKYMTVVEVDAFYGLFQSDEIHRYKLLWVDGEYKAINYMVGDTTSSRTLWFELGARQALLTELMRRFPKPFSLESDEEIYTPETGSKITESRYLSFMHDGESIWAFNKSPNHGGLLGPCRGAILLESKPDGDMYKSLGPVLKHRTHSYTSYAEHHMPDGSVIHDAKQKNYMRLERVIPFSPICNILENTSVREISDFIHKGSSGKSTVITTNESPDFQGAIKEVIDACS